MKGRITIDAGAGIKETEDVNLTTRQNENVSAVVSRLEGNIENRSRLIGRIQQLWSRKCWNKKFNIKNTRKFTLTLIKSKMGISKIMFL